jgi:tetratricopeptide (TPR) repeat protein
MGVIKSSDQRLVMHHRVFFQDKFPRLSVLLAVVLLFGCIRFPLILQVNKWSMAFLRHAVRPEQCYGCISAPPNGHDRARVWLARELLSDGDPERALELLENAPASQKADILRIKASASLSLGKIPSALAYWEELGDYRSLSSIAKELVSSSRMSDREEAYMAAWRIDPVKGTYPLASFLLEEKNDPAGASRVLRMALANTEEEVSSWFQLLGRAEREQGNWNEAIEAFRRALSTDPDDLRTLRMLALANVQGKKDYEAARQVVREMLTLAPEQGDGYFVMGEILSSEGDYREAARWFSQSIEMDPSDPYRWQVWALNARNMGDYSLSLFLFHKAIHQFPDYAPAYYELAGIYIVLDQPTEAARAIQKALELQSHPDAWYYIRAGEIYRWSGNRTLAIKAYNKARGLASGDASVIDAVENAMREIDRSNHK